MGLSNIFRRARVNMPSIRTIRYALLALAIFLAASTAISGLVDFSAGLIAYATKRFGKEAPHRLQTFQAEVHEIKAMAGADFKQAVTHSSDGKAEMPVLREVNDFFNQVPYIPDVEHWKVEDYWATPVEFVASFGGECKDYSIAKYMTLKEVGVPIERMRITYVRALRLGESHMVLAYYPTPDADPLILDNLDGEIKRASARTDLAPVFSFNDDDLWMASGTTRKGGASNVRLWRDLLDKMEQERKM
jgi:predicted transglutaminase-like cysteine proteinase